MSVITPQKPWRFSATSAEMAQDCMYAFSQKYELGIEEIPGRPLHVGRVLSTTVERYLVHCFENKVPTDVTEIAAIARAVFAEQGQGVGLDVLDEVLRVVEYYAEAFAVDLERIAGAEMWLPPTGADPLTIGGRDVVGKVDQLLFDDEGAVAIVIDDKSHWSVWSDDECRRKLQTRLYPVLVFHSFPLVEEVEIRYRFIRWGIERVVRVNRAEAELERQKLEALAKLMQKPGPRPATPGERCGFCGYVSRCPVFKSARENGVFIVPTNADEARKVIETVLVLEAGLKQRREALNAFTDQNGPIEVKGVRFGHFQSESVRVLTPRFREWAKENGVDADDWLEVPAKDLERLLKKKRSLATLTYVETKTRFSEKRSDETEKTSAA